MVMEVFERKSSWNVVIKSMFGLQAKEWYSNVVQRGAYCAPRNLSHMNLLGSLNSKRLFVENVEFNWFWGYPWSGHFSVIPSLVSDIWIS